MTSSLWTCYLSPLQFLCTDFCQLVHCTELLPTPVQLFLHRSALCFTAWILCACRSCLSVFVVIVLFSVAECLAGKMSLKWSDFMLACLSGMRCRLACSPADATATHYLLLQWIQIGSKTFLVLPFWYLLTQVILDILQKSSKTVVCV